MRIRDGADAAAAAEVVQRVLHEHGLPFEPRDLDADIVAPAAHYQGSGGAFFVAVDGTERVVGTAGLLRTGPRSGEVRRMFLLPEARRQGAGRALRLTPARDRTPSRPAGGRRRPAPVPSIA